MIITEMGVCCMQLSILAKKVCMLDSRKLFFSQKSDLKNRIRLDAQGASFKKFTTFTLSWLLMFFFLSLPAQVLFAEGIIKQTASRVTEDISRHKVGLDSHAASVATEIIANENASVANEITSIITTKHHPYLVLSNFINRTEDLDALYKVANYQLLWLGNAQAKKNIVEVLNLLNDASVSGLDALNYDAYTLHQKLEPALKLAPDNYRLLALYDTAISLSLLRFLHDLHYGRVNPQGINYKVKLREKKLIDLPSMIKDSLALGTIKQLPLLVEPKLQQYQKLKSALATYRLLARKSPPFQLRIEKSINPGGNLRQIEELQRFLVTVGDMPEEGDNGDDAGKSIRYMGKIVTAVKKFQQRHGLNADGVIGKGTVAAINVPLSQRVTQIELAMERLRWLPELNAGPYIIVNIPAFQLWAFDDIDRFSSDIANMKVVVGKAMKNETPVLMAEMRFIDFMPYWNVPYNIVKQEILPKLMQNPSYLGSENMELVTTFGNETKAVAFTYSSIAQLKQGTLRVRQRPGKKNALGKVKFIFPNKEDVYLHDTPSQTLFSKSRRDFSHGCVRVANPEGLAEFALKNQWSKETIQQALNTPKTQRVILKKSIPVLFLYITSFFDHDNNLAFYPDIYGYDDILLGALRKPEDLSDQSIFVSVNVAPAVPDIKNN
ncbi:MAG: L,D-transpeptidase family protein [Methylococcaceae bacterium]|nr:L,D-transpeptidase family protein [Methylococcaceae bacterium]